VLWDHSRLYLIMDYLDVDLREHLDTDPSARDLANVKARAARHGRTAGRHIGASRRRVCCRLACLCVQPCRREGAPATQPPAPAGRASLAREPSPEPEQADNRYLGTIMTSRAARARRACIGARSCICTKCSRRSRLRTRAASSTAT